VLNQFIFAKAGLPAYFDVPISLKNAVKCDKWYQLQNLSITESLNANGAWKQGTCVPTSSMPASVSNKNQPNKQEVDSVLAGKKIKILQSSAVAFFVLAFVGAIVEQISFGAPLLHFFLFLSHRKSINVRGATSSVQRKTHDLFSHPRKGNEKRKTEPKQSF
jgi:hypothetical protein